MSFDATKSLGMLIDPTSGRDAVHIAVAPVIAVEPLTPGDHIGFYNRKDDKSSVGKYKPFLGIADPFLTSPIQPGQYFWMFLYPRTITSLNHQWTHPAFSSEVENAVAWITDWADSYGVPFTTMIQKAQEYLKNGEYFSMGGTFEGETVPSLFWDKYEIIYGVNVKESLSEDHSSAVHARNILLTPRSIQHKSHFAP